MSNFTRHTKASVGDGTTTGTSLATIKKGDLLLVDKFGNPITTAAAAGALDKNATVRIASCLYDGKPIYSGDIAGGLVRNYIGQDFVDKADQVTYLGYTGSAGDGIQSNPDTSYRLKIIIKDDYRTGQRQTVAESHFTTGASTTASELAYNINFLFNQKHYDQNFAENFVTLERTSDGTRSAFAANITVENGSRKVLCTGHGLSAGDVVKIKGASYIISAVDTNEFTLDLSYVGVSEVIATTEANSGSYATVTKWGFKLTGVSIDSLISRADNDPLDNYEWVNFKAIFGTSDDVGTDVYIAEETTTKGNPGQGYWKQVAQSEQDSRYERGVSSPRKYYNQIPILNTVVGTGYGSVVIEHDAETGGFAGEYAASRMTTEVYLPTGSDQADDTGDNFLAILNAYFDGVLGLGAIPAL